MTWDSWLEQLVSGEALVVLLPVQSQDLLSPAFRSI